MDYKTEEELAADPSPFALASLIQLRKIQAGRDVQQRYRFKLAFIRELYSRGYARDDILKLFRFMDYILRLPDDLASRFRSELESIEEKLRMPYVTSVERLAKREGIEQGIKQGIDRVCKVFATYCSRPSRSVLVKSPTRYAPASTPAPARSN